MRRHFRQFSKDKLGLIGAGIIVTFILVALFANQLAPHPEQGKGVSDVTNKLLAPSSTYWLGTDEFGRDILSRILYGMQSSLTIAFQVIIFVLVIGVVLGAVAGFFGGLIDNIIMRITDIFLAFPPMLLAIALVAVLGPSLRNAIIAISLSWWPWYARLVRSSTMAIKTSAFIEASTVMQVSNIKIIFRHIIPNITTPVIVQASVDVGTVILSAASLSFLGLGAQPPTADLGQMVGDGRTFILQEWWISTFPGLVILFLVMSFNILGDSLRDYLDPLGNRR